LDALSEIRWPGFDHVADRPLANAGSLEGEQPREVGGVGKDRQLIRICFICQQRQLLGPDAYLASLQAPDSSGRDK
jgi:hypothetical protein